MTKCKSCQNERPINKSGYCMTCKNLFFPASGSVFSSDEHGWTLTTTTSVPIDQKLTYTGEFEVVSVIDILGVDYKLYVRKRSDEPKLQELAGYCDSSAKFIVVRDLCDPDDTRISDMEELHRFQAKVTRHEIAHAFYRESGADPDYMTEEQMCEWLAVVGGRYVEACKQAGAWLE